MQQNPLNGRHGCAYLLLAVLFGLGTFWVALFAGPFFYIWMMWRFDVLVFMNRFCKVMAGFHLIVMCCVLGYLLLRMFAGGKPQYSPRRDDR